MVKLKEISNMKKIIILSVLILLISGVSYGLYEFYKPHQSITDKSPAFKLDAKVLVADYDKDEKKANEKYLGKIVEVRGIVSEKIKDNKGNYNLTLQGEDLAGIGCEFDPNFKENVASIKEGQEITIKGICTGVLMDVVLVDCVIEEN